MINHSYIQYAYTKEKKLVLIFDVPNGRRCNCFCTVCGGKLGAKNKNKTRDSTLSFNQKVAHFYHLNNSGCDGESLLHLMAKEILFEEKTLLVHLRRETQFHKVLPDEITLVEFEEVVLEKKLQLGDKFIKPDAIGKVKGKDLLIEFVYTHEVDFDKECLIKEYKRNCLVINLDFPYIDWNEFDGEDLKARLRLFLRQEGTFHQYWIYNSKFTGGKKIVMDSKEEKARWKKLLEEEEQRRKFQEEEEWRNKKLKVIAAFFRSENHKLVWGILLFEGQTM